MAYEIPNITSQISFLYVEHAYIHVQDSAILIIKQGAKTPVPSYALACLILGPGTTITHAAIKLLQNSGCIVVWDGQDQNVFYASGMEESRKSKNFLKQVDYYSSEKLHMQVVKKMYQKRFPDKDLKRMSLSQMRGAEGIRVKEQYKESAEKYGVEWDGRTLHLEDWDANSFVNQALTVGNKLLYNICHAVILAMGYSPTIGFIHTGNMRSFVYDIADLYKKDFIIDTVFSAIANGASTLEEIQTSVRNKVYTKKLIQTIVDDLSELFDDENVKTVDDQGLWDTKQNIVPYSVNWGEKE